VERLITLFLIDAAKIEEDVSYFVTFYIVVPTQIILAVSRLSSLLGILRFAKSTSTMMLMSVNTSIT